MRWVRESLGKIDPYRPGQRASEVRRELGLDEVVKLSSNESAYPPLESATRAMSRVVRELRRYPDSGCGRLKKKLAGQLNSAIETIMIGNGSNELLRLLADVLLEPGDEVIMASPSFVVYPLVTRLRGANLVEIPLNDLTHDLEAMAEAVGPRTKLIFVCNPNNPTGTIVSSEAVGDFLRAVPERTIVCFDEAYHEFVVDPGYRSALDWRGDHPNVVVMRTFSKIYGLAGARIGYAVAAPSIVETIDKIREPFNVNTVAQVGAYYSLDEGLKIDRRREQNAVERNFVESQLDEAGLQRADSQANFVYFDCKMPAMEAFERLKSQGVIVRAFGNGSYIRATLGTRAENERLVAALRSVVGGLADQPKA